MKNDRLLRIVITTAMVLFLLTAVVVPAFAGTEGNVLYGIREVTNPDGSITYTAYILPDFSSNDVDFVTGIRYSFWLPAGTVINSCYAMT